MPSPSLPGPSLPPDSEPAVPPSLPDIGLWSESDIGSTTTLLKPGPAPAAPAERPADTQATIGHIGRYALKRLIGEGGLGTVYAAHDPLLSRLIAIKTLNLQVSADQRPAFNALFLNEARAAASLSHPHIVTVFDAGVSDDKAYIAMELLKGRDLRQLSAEGWRPTPQQAALIVRRVADALAYAHSKGVVHRDVKPANIFMVGRTQPRVLDFGIARVAHQHEGGAGDDIAAGSPWYMSPEQARQLPVDRRTDVFSLGVVLYELLTGARPFRGATLAEITAAVVQHDPPPAHLVSRDVPQALSEIAARAMEKDPEHRLRSARALSRELRHWLQEHGQAREAAEAATADRRRRLALAAATAGGVLLAAFGAWSLTRAPERTRLASAAAAPAVAAADARAPHLATASPPSSTAAADHPPAATAVGAAAPGAIDRHTPAQPTAERPAGARSAAGPSASRHEARPVPAKNASRDRRVADTTRSAGAPAAGTVRLAVSPWGEVEVDGAPVGTVPPLTELRLPEGRYRIVVRNTDFPALTTTVRVRAGTPVTLKHRFGS